MRPVVIVAPKPKTKNKGYRGTALLFGGGRVIEAPKPKNSLNFFRSIANARKTRKFSEPILRTRKPNNMDNHASPRAWSCQNSSHFVLFLLSLFSLSMCSRWLTAIDMFISLASICFFAHNQGNAPFTLIAFNDSMTHNILESSAPLAFSIVIILLYSYFFHSYF